MSLVLGRAVSQDQAAGVKTARRVKRRMRAQASSDDSEKSESDSSEESSSEGERVRQ